VASRLFAEGRNPVQVQRWLGHHSPSFTIDTYVHLLDDDVGEPLTQVHVRSTHSPQTALPGFGSTEAADPASALYRGEFA